MIDGFDGDFGASLHALQVALDERDSYTHGHCDRVGALADALAREVAPARVDFDHLALAARFHDIGKIGIPDDVLLHPGQLDAARMAVMRTHPLRGARVFAATGRRDAQEVARLIRHHHEAIDSSGYPDGLAGNAIPLEARILAVVDGFDAMTSDRPYRAGLPEDEALRRLRADAGLRLDGLLVEAFIALQTQT